MTRAMRIIASNNDAETHQPHLGATLASDARRFGHHGVANLIAVARMRERVAITADYAAELIRHAGMEPKP